MRSSEALSETKARIAEARAALASQRSAPSDYCSLIDSLVGGLGKGAGWDGHGRSLVALGGYGRGELAPRSDIDLLFLVDRHGRHQPPVDPVLYPLWDLGFDVGHAVRTPSECAELSREDLTAATALLESRLLLGDDALFEEARRRSGISAGGTKETRRWVPRIVEEVARRRERFGEISHLLEPHVKEGRGGLRDFQASRWLLECIGRPPSAVADLPRGAEACTAYDFLFRVRNALHAVAGRKTDHLTFDFHRDVATSLFPGEPIESFFQALHFAGHRISTLWDDAVDVAQQTVSRTLPWKRRLGDLSAEELLREIDDWSRSGGPLAPRARRTLSNLDIHATAKVLHPALGRILRTRARLAPLLRELHRLGKMVAVFPELDAVIHQVRYDARHAYTTGIHCVEALSALEDLWLGLLEKEEPHLTLLASRLEEPHVVRLAALCHDLGLASTGAEHATAGADIARSIALRIGFREEEADAVAALVREHHVLPSLALRSDPESPASWAKARQAARPPASLDGLLLLAFADISATQPRGHTSAWGDWTRDLFLTLCARAESAGPEAPTARISPAASLPGAAQAPRREVSQVPADLFQRLLRMGAELGDRTSTWTVEFRARGFVEVLGVAHGGARVLTAATGVLAALRLDILSVQVHAWRDGTVHIWLRASAVGPAPTSEEVTRRLEATVCGEMPLPKITRSGLSNPREDAMPVDARVRLSDGEDPYHSVLEVQCRDRRGLMYDLARVFEKLGLNATYALITTAGPTARDTFHLQDIFGGRIDGQHKVKALLEQVSAVTQASRSEYDSPRHRSRHARPLRDEPTERKETPP